ncbi:MAG: class I SAM-dependent methyltransferase, partial [Ktedonobacterales bacterium]
MSSTGGDAADQQPVSAALAPRDDRSPDALSSGSPSASGRVGLVETAALDEFGVDAPTVAHLRIPNFGARYLEQARRQLFARHPDYLPFLVRHLGVHPGMTVVDIGCGTGVYTRILASRLHGEGVAIGVDALPAMIERAKEQTLAEGWG